MILKFKNYKQISVLIKMNKNNTQTYLFNQTVFLSNTFNKMSLFRQEQQRQRQSYNINLMSFSLQNNS